MTADQGRPRSARTRPRGTQRTRLNLQVTLPTGDGAVRLARRVTRDVLARRRLAHIEDTAVLLVSELVTNAVRHARNTYAIALDLEIGETWLRIEVQDADPRWPRPRTPGRLAESGFGLVLVDALAGQWGVRETATGKAVWAELDTRHPAEPVNLGRPGGGDDLPVSAAAVRGKAASLAGHGFQLVFRLLGRRDRRGTAA